MDNLLPPSVVAWAREPAMQTLALLVLGLAIIIVVARALRRALAAYVSENTARYQARKLTTFLGYIGALACIALMFSDRLGGLTVAFGVAGAGIAFALQEVIASVAGWVAVSFGGFYKVGDRVQLGGIKGDVIDIGVLRTTGCARIFKRHMTPQERGLKRLPAEPAVGRSTQVWADFARSLGVWRLGTGELTGL